MPSQEIKNILVTGAAGKVGRRLAPALLDAGYHVRALQHRSPLPFDNVEVLRGSVSDKEVVRRALRDVDAVCHLATSKEDPETFIDVSLRGTFNLLDACRESGRVRRFILASGDAALGIYFYPSPAPLDETAPLRAYPGCYALSKVLEETLCRQYGIQYGLPYTILRFSWVQEEDDILAHMTLQAPNFGVPVWRELAKTPEQAEYFKTGTDAVVNLVHPSGASYVRHVVGIDDVVDAFLRALDNPAAAGETFNIAAPSSFSYESLSRYIADRLDSPVVTLAQDGFHDFTINVTKARTLLGCPLRVDMETLVEKAIKFRRSGGRRSDARYVG